MKLKFFNNNTVSDKDVSQRIYNFEDFDAVYVNASDRYQQKDYDRILSTEQKKNIN